MTTEQLVRNRSTFARLGARVPRIAETAWVAPTASLIGDVEIGEEAGIWFNCVLRGDTNAIRIGARTNIQDGTIIHVDPGPYATIIGSDVTVGHSCLLHGCVLQDGAFVGMNTTILNGAVVEEGGVLGAGSLLTSGKRVKRGELWTGSPARLSRTLTEEQLSEFASVAPHYVQNGQAFRANCEVIDRSECIDRGRRGGR